MSNEQPKPRTPRQMMADYRRTLPRKINERRGQLIEKKYGGFTDEEGSRRLDLDPTWKAEFESRVHDNLTDDERTELVECDRIMEEWWAGSPQAVAQREKMEQNWAELERIQAVIQDDQS